MSVVWVLPGQGSLRPGCLAAATATDGRAELASLADAAGTVVEQVATASDLDLWQLSEQPATAARTAHAQPTILAASLAAAAALEAAGVRPDMVAGHSLGECTAAVVAGTYPVEVAARIVAARGAAMAEACATNPGSLAAVVKLSTDGLAAILEQHPDVVVANDNAPGQVVIAGPPAAIDAVRGDVREAGGRLVPLDVEGAFHSPAMRPAVPHLAAALDRAEAADPHIPLVSGVDARPRLSGDGVSDALLAGLLAPVRWREVQVALAAEGATHLVEVGPGGVLAGLARRTVPELEVRTVATPADAHTLAAELGVTAGVT